LKLAIKNTKKLSHSMFNNPSSNMDKFFKKIKDLNTVDTE